MSEDIKGELLFDPMHVARLVLHAAASPKHTPTWTALLREGARMAGKDLDDPNVDYAQWDGFVEAAKAADFDPPAALSFVKDQGIYVMSNGKPQLDNDDPGRVIFAQGFDPTKDAFDDWWEGARQLVGGDDFVEPLYLDEAQISRAHLIAGGKLEADSFFIEVSDEMLSYGFAVAEEET